MAKTSKVTELKHMEGTDNYGNYSHIVKFENGDGGFCRTKDPEGKAYSVGNNVEYEIEERTKKDGVSKYNVIKRVKPQQSPYANVPKKKSADDYKAEAILVAATNTANIIAVRQDLSDADIPKYFNAFQSQMYKALDQLNVS